MTASAFLTRRETRSGDLKSRRLRSVGDFKPPLLDRRSRSGGARVKLVRQLAHHFHAGRAAIVAHLFRRKFVPHRDAALPDLLQLGIVDANGGEPIPVPLLAGAVNETFDGLRDLLACPLHELKLCRAPGPGQGERKTAATKRTWRCRWQSRDAALICVNPWL